MVGQSGSGKSTIAQLIEKFYTVNKGQILIDGTPVEKLDTKWLRGRIGYINQEPSLFHASVKENIRLGNPDASDQDILNACEKANCMEFIAHFPDGLDTMVGEGGSTLSGGQKQRVAIARALLKNPDILILDEATSALDNKSERLVQEALDYLSRDKTTITIAHRLSTIRNAERIVVMKGGLGIVEEGSHDELLNRRGRYFDLYHNSG